MSKVDELFEWWRNLAPGLRPNPFAYSKRNDVELAQFQSTLSEKLEGLQATLERPFKEERDTLNRELRGAYARVTEWLDHAKERFTAGSFEMDYFTQKGALRLTWRPILPQIVAWLDGLKESIVKAAKRPLDRPFLSLVGADPECLDVPDFHPFCGFWSDNYMIGGYPWRTLNWNPIVGTGVQVEHAVPPLNLARSLPHTVWLDLLDEVAGDVRKGHKAVKDCPWTVAHALCDLTKPDGGPNAPNMAQASGDRVCWATSLHVPFRGWLHAEAAKFGIASPLEYTRCYPTWLGFSTITGDDPTGMIGGPEGHQRACFFAFLLDELSTLWGRRKREEPTGGEYKKAWHGAAIAYWRQNPNALAAEIARAARVSRSTVSRDPMMSKLLMTRRELRQGFRDDDGNIIGIVNPDLPED